MDRRGIAQKGANDGGKRYQKELDNKDVFHDLWKARNPPFAGIFVAEADHFSLRRSGLVSRRVSVARFPSPL